MKQNLLVIVISLMIGLSSYKGISQEFSTESYSHMVVSHEDGTEEVFKVPSYFKISDKLGEIKILSPDPVTTYFEIEEVKEIEECFYIKGINSHAVTIELLYYKEDSSLAIIINGSKTIYVLIK